MACSGAGLRGGGDGQDDPMADDDSTAIDDPTPASDDDAADDDTAIPATAMLTELLPSNQEGLADDFGEFDDWVELHNPGSEPLDFSGWRLADDPDAEEPWTVGEGVVIPAFGYLLIWCDEDPDQGPTHATFKLSSDGESVVLWDPNGEEVDRVDFDPIDPDSSWSLVQDGWEQDLTPTPGLPND
jgi:hypothetical protein